MEQERNAIEKELATLVFYLQGGINVSDSYMLNENQIKTYSEVIKQHYEMQSSKLTGDRNR